ncbi:MAG: N-formylglutamate deformylase [Proteobacteria bacterium]|nr:N-formylglutamate deformylase [Pseudomonadota bacterium]
MSDKQIRELFRFQEGDTPLLLSVPHAGTYLPGEIAAALLPEARELPDTDWYVDRLYDFVPELGASLIVANHSRYVIDLNRAPDQQTLYPGADNTELCPLSDFDRRPLYPPGGEPGGAEIARRLDAYWRPYHRQIRRELERIKDRFGLALLFDAHSIRSKVPRFFDGRLPDLNLGTADGASAPDALARRLYETAEAESAFSVVLNGRFKGGFITRHYGDPQAHIHAVQLELAQASYMDEIPPRYRPERARRLRPVLKRLLGAISEWAEKGP